MDLLNTYKSAALKSNRSILTLLLEAVRLRLSPKRLGLTEYIDFRLYEKDLTWTEKLNFGGQRAQAEAEELLIDDCSSFLSLDKVTMYALLKGFDFPIPRLYATYRSTRPSHHRQIHSKDKLIEFFKAPENLPVYIKRSFGSYGRGNVLVSNFDGCNVTLGGGSSEPIDQFVDSLDNGRSLGWILQQPLTSHHSIEKLTGSTKISGLRVHTFMGKTQPIILKAIFKVNAGIRDSDNFEHGASGNLLASIDIQSGTILRAISGTGLNQRELQENPRTGIKLVGFTLPHWQDVLHLVLDAQRAFPGFLCPGWDIALCEDGPKILEVNVFGDIDLSQHAYRESFFDDVFMTALRERTLDNLLHKKSGKQIRSPINGRVGVKKHHWLW
jgi:hypothetical protein